MDHLKETARLKIQDVVQKLQKMECTLLGNRDDAWVMELLFNPGFHRYHLIEWILSKLDYDVRKITGPQNSPEERMKNLQTTISILGIRRENSHEITKGTASVEEQLEFWCLLVDLLWLKDEISGNISLTDTDEGVALSPTRSGRNAIYEEYKEAAACINSICESVNLKHLFCYDLKLIAPDVKREIEQMSTSELRKAPVPNLQEFKNLAKQKNHSTESKDLYKSLLSQSEIDVTQDKFQEDNESEDSLNELEDSMLKISQLIQNHAQGDFNDVYNDLKHLIRHATPEEFTDVGPTFQKVEQNLERVLQLKESLSKLASSSTKFLKTSSELDNLSNHQNIADSKSVNIARLLKEEI